MNSLVNIYSSEIYSQEVCKCVTGHIIFNISFDPPIYISLNMGTKKYTLLVAHQIYESFISSVSNSKI